VQNKLGHAFLKTIPILLGLITIILVPRVLTGYWYLNQAGFFLSNKQESRAALAYEDAAMRLGWSKGLYEQAAMLSWGSGDIQQAGRLFQRAMDQDGLSDQGLLALGDLYLKQDQAGQAVETWMRVPASSQRYVPALERLAKTRQSLGDYGLAQSAWQTLVEVDPGNAGAHFGLGLLLMTSQPHAALQELIQAATLDPALETQVSPLRDNLTRAVLVEDQAYQQVVSGQALASIGEWDLARLAFTNATRTNPDFPEAWCWLGEDVQHIGRDGLPALNEGLALNPNSTTCLALMALHDRRNNKLNEAWTIYEKVAKQEPANPAWQIALGDLSVQKGDLLSARGYYQAAIDLGGNDPGPWKAMASFSIQYNVDVENLGLKAAYHLLDIAPKDWESEDLVGQALIAIHSLEAARNHFLKALALAPDQADIHLHLGYLYLLMDKFTESYEQLSRASELDATGASGGSARRLLAQYFP